MSTAWARLSTVPSAVTVRCISSLGLRQGKHMHKDRNEQEQTTGTRGSVNNKDQQLDAIRQSNNTECINWGESRTLWPKKAQNYWKTFSDKQGGIRSLMIINNAIKIMFSHLIFVAHFNVLLPKCPGRVSACFLLQAVTQFSSLYISRGNKNRPTGALMRVVNSKNTWLKDSEINKWWFFLAINKVMRQKNKTHVLNHYNLVYTWAPKLWESWRKHVSVFPISPLTAAFVWLKAQRWMQKWLFNQLVGEM